MNSCLHCRDRDQSGLTLVELLVVIIIIAIVAGIALMQRGSANEVFRRQNVAQELKVAFERARFDSVKRRADDSTTQAKVLVEADQYTLTTFIDSSGTMTASDITSTTSGQNVVLAGHRSLSLPVTVYFNRRGEAVDSAGASISPVFLVCNSSCASPTAANSNIVVVTPTGTVNLLGDESRIPTFGNANVTAVNTATGINNTVSLP